MSQELVIAVERIAISNYPVEFRLAAYLLIAVSAIYIAQTIQEYLG